MVRFNLDIKYSFEVCEHLGKPIMDINIDFLLITVFQRARRAENISDQRIILRSLRDNSDPFRIPSNVFIKEFRMPQRIALKLIDLLEEHDGHQYSTIPFHIRVLGALSLFAHGSYQKPTGRHNLINLSQPSISRCVKHVAELIVAHLHHLVMFPQTLNDVNAAKSGFLSTFGLENTIGCIDCTHIAVVAPPETDEVHHPRHYRNRKRFYSINVEAVCDAKLKFLAVNARFPGSCHDSGIWQMSGVKVVMQQLQSITECWLIGDSGYPLEPWLLTPYSQPQLEHEKAFNVKHVLTRNSIERAFGTLKSIFRCLLKHRTLHYHPVNAVKIINACFILHNFMHVEGVINLPVDDDNIELLQEVEFETEICTDHTSVFNRGRQVRDYFARSLLHPI